MLAEAIEEHGTDDGDDSGLDRRDHGMVGINAGGGGALCVAGGDGLGDEVTDAEDDAVEGGGAGTAEDDAASVEQGVKAGGDGALEESEFIGVVGVEGGAVETGGVGDVLDGELVEVASIEEVAKGLLEEFASAADAGVE